MRTRFTALELFFSLIILCLSFSSLSAQTRLAVLPIQNMDGKMDMNIYCYKIQDSLYKTLVTLDPQSTNFVVVPPDSIEALLTELNIDPTNPQYPSDMWKIVKRLNIQKVICGNFNLSSGKFLMNAYIYDVRTKMPNNQYQARDIFLDMDKIMDCVPQIMKELQPALPTVTK
jgi:TolB-like protein